MFGDFPELFVVAFVLIAPGIALAIVFWRSRANCPNCRRFAASRKTGATREEGGVLLGTSYEEYKCIECDHVRWVEQKYSGPS